MKEHFCQIIEGSLIVILANGSCKFDFRFALNGIPYWDDLFWFDYQAHYFFRRLQMEQKHPHCCLEEIPGKNVILILFLLVQPQQGARSKVSDKRMEVQKF